MIKKFETKSRIRKVSIDFKFYNVVWHNIRIFKVNFNPSYFDD